MIFIITRGPGIVLGKLISTDLTCRYVQMSCAVYMYLKKPHDILVSA